MYIRNTALSHWCRLITEVKQRRARFIIEQRRARFIIGWVSVGAVSIRRGPRKSTMWSTWHAHKAMNDIMNDNWPS